jgi:hypothetical protein
VDLPQPRPGHVALLAGHSSQGRRVHEVVPALQREDGYWDLLGTPALAMGCAAGDVLAVEEDGAFQVVSRGGNLAIVSYVPKAQDISAPLAALTDGFGSLGGTVETPADRRFVVVTVPASAGFPAVEAQMQRWQESTALDWYFGNVYDLDDEPLGWWASEG